TMAERVNADSSGSYKAQEWLSLILQPGRWLCLKVWKGIKSIARRLSTYNERQAKADKTRKEGKALLVKAEAEAAVIEAKTRTETAKGRAQEIKNETAEELLRQIRERGIDMAAELRDGQLQVGVVKDESLTVPPVQDGEEKNAGTAKKPQRRQAGRPKEPPE